MPVHYDRNFKAMVVDHIVKKKYGTSQAAIFFGVPLKTLEKWITAFNKDNSCFSDNYISDKAKIKLLEKQIAELENQNLILKKTIALLGNKD